MSDDPPSNKNKSYSRTWQNVESVRKYSKTRYHSLDQRFVSWRERKIVNKMLNKIKLPGSKLLDIPTGYGRFTQLFLENDFDITNADLNLFALLYQREQHLGTANSVVANVLDIPFKNNQFDVVFNFRLLQHFKTSKERCTFLKELRISTKKWAIVSVYIKSNLHIITQKISSRKRKMTMIDLDAWREEVTNEGFKIVESRRVIPSFHAQMIFLLEKIN